MSSPEAFFCAQLVPFIVGNFFLHLVDEHEKNAAMEMSGLQNGQSKSGADELHLAPGMRLKSRLRENFRNGT